jgi:hypothetical protein
MKKIKKNKSPEMSIFKYIKDNKGRIKGLMVGFAIIDGRENNRFAVGYSLCNPKDEFNINVAIDLCFLRAKGKRNEKIPHSIRKDVSYFMDRCSSYFQDKMFVPKFSSDEFSLIDMYKLLPKEFADKWNIVVGNSVKTKVENSSKKQKSNVSVFYCREMNSSFAVEEFDFTPHKQFVRKILSSDFEFKNCTSKKPELPGNYVKLTIEYF